MEKKDKKYIFSIAYKDWDMICDHYNGGNHIIPTRDSDIHAPSDSCKCNPQKIQTIDGSLEEFYLHASFDNREWNQMLNINNWKKIL